MRKCEYSVRELDRILNESRRTRGVCASRRRNMYANRKHKILANNYLDDEKLSYYHEDNNWVSGRIGNCKFEAKIFDEGSEFGIDGGRISKLWIGRGNKTICNYDRGWDIRPIGQDKLILNKILREFN